MNPLMHATDEQYREYLLASGRAETVRHATRWAVGDLDGPIDRIVLAVLSARSARRYGGGITRDR